MNQLGFSYSKAFNNINLFGLRIPAIHGAKTAKSQTPLVHFA